MFYFRPLVSIHQFLPKKVSSSEWRARHSNKSGRLLITSPCTLHSYHKPEVNSYIKTKSLIKLLLQLQIVKLFCEYLHFFVDFLICGYSNFNLIEDSYFKGLYILYVLLQILNVKFFNFKIRFCLMICYKYKTLKCFICWKSKNVKHFIKKN